MTTRCEVWITTQFEALHYYPDAPKEVDWLRYPHRHLFRVKVAVAVTELNRQVEFFQLKHRVEDFCQAHKGEWREASCEMMALAILEGVLGEKEGSVEVSEDGENGALVMRTK